MTTIKAIAVVGPTATGKTSLAIKLADFYQGEIISADSRQVYQGMDVGTGKDLADYDNNGQPITYHLIDIVDPNQVFDLANYQKLAQQALLDINRRQKLPILAGGSGLYLQALIDNYQLSTAQPDPQYRQELEELSTEQLYQKLLITNPKLATRLNNSDRHNPRRLIRYLEITNNPIPTKIISNTSPLVDWLILGLDFPIEILEQRIYQRLLQRLEHEDMIQEVIQLQQQGVSWSRLESFGLEYRYLSYYLQEKIDYEEMVEQLSTAIRQFAKRQKTWFKRWEKQGQTIHWLNTNQPLIDAKTLINNWLNNH